MISSSLAPMRPRRDVVADRRLEQEDVLQGRWAMDSRTDASATGAIVLTTVEDAAGGRRIELCSSATVVDLPAPGMADQRRGAAGER